MALTYLGLGSNLGNKQQNLNLAISELILYAGNILKVSSFYETTPWGFSSENSFLNAVVLLETNYPPLVLLRKTQKIEKRLGRSKKSDGTYSDRIIDIDILLYDRQVIDLPELKIPHPLMTERDFVLRPLLELTPDLIHPLTGRELVLH